MASSAFNHTNKRDEMNGKRLFLYLFIAAVMLGGCASSTGVPGIKHISIPSDEDRHPAVIVLPTQGGVHPHVVEFASKLSRRGYVTVVVDFIRTRGGTDNIDAAHDFLSTHPSVLSDRIGVVGFSKGANQAVAFSKFSHKFTERRVQAVVAYYTGPSSGPNDELQPPILFLHGDQDSRVSPGHIRRFCQRQLNMGTVCKVHIYEGVTHAFDQPSSWSCPIVGGNWFSS
jgi:dienelactone hydrolase